MTKLRPTMFRTLLLGGLLAGLPHAPGLPGRAATAAGFDCAKAQALDERLICADPALSEEDGRLADSYRAVLKDAEAAGLDQAVRERLRRGQRGWLADRNRDCGIATTPKPNAEERAAMTECLKHRTVTRREALVRLREGLPVSALIESRSVKEVREKEGYEIDADYPVLDAAAPGAAAFNRAVERTVMPAIDAFRKSVAEMAEEDPEFKPEMPATLTINHQLGFASPKLLSVQFDSYDFPAGAAHGTPSTTTLHVDLVTGKALTAKDVFREETGWRKALVEHCVAELRRLGKEGDFEFNDGPEPSAESVAASVEDLGKWRLEAGRAVIVFDPYQVAAFALGTHEVPVSYALLRPYLKADGPLPPQR